MFVTLIPETYFMNVLNNELLIKKNNKTRQQEQQTKQYCITSFGLTLDHHCLDLQFNLMSVLLQQD